LDKLQQAAEDGMEAQLHILHAIIGNDEEHRLTREQAEDARGALREAMDEIRKIGVVRAECDKAQSEIRRRVRETKAKIQELLEGAQGSIEGSVEEICPDCDGAGVKLPSGELTKEGAKLEPEDCPTCGGRGTIGPGGCDA
jgi:predicted  nucleic acid-binding Zn-ribbon protein